MGLRKVSAIDKIDHEICSITRQLQTLRQELAALREKDQPKRQRRPKTNLIDPRTGKTFQTKIQVKRKN